MEVVVVGAGVVGMTTACFLAEAGHTVTVVDRAPDVATGASYANAGQLSYGYADPLCAPTVIKQLPSILLGRETGIKFALQGNVDDWTWSWQFLRNCTPRRFAGNSAVLLALALRSRHLMQRFHHAIGGQYHHASNGKLVLLDQPGRTALHSIEAKAAAGCRQSLLNAEEATDLEPAIASLRTPWSHAIYSPDDEVGDARRFCQALRSCLETRGIKFELAQSVESLRIANRRIRAVVTEAQAIPCDGVVVCAGMGAKSLLRPVGIKLPLRSIVGYSVTAPLGSTRLTTSITIPHERMVYSRIGDELRVAGFADIGAPKQSRVADLTERALQIGGELSDNLCSPTSKWIGQRPTTPNCLPVVGATHLPGLFVNTGHGMLGWTLAAGTAERVVRSIEKSLT